jgi:hypothetical protein
VFLRGFAVIVFITGTLCLVYDMPSKEQWKLKLRSSRLHLSVMVGYQCFEGSIVLQNIGILPHQYTVSQPKSP